MKSPQKTHEESSDQTTGYGTRRLCGRHFYFISHTTDSGAFSFFLLLLTNSVMCENWMQKQFPREIKKVVEVESNKGGDGDL